MTRAVRLLTLPDDNEAAAHRQTASLAGLAATLLLVAVSLFLIRTLQQKTAIEDCLLAGGRNCDVIAAPAGPSQID